MTPTRSTTGAWVMDKITQKAVVTEIEQILPRMKRIRLSGSCVATMTWHPGQHLRVNVQREPLLPAVLRGTIREQLRTYTILAVNRAAGTLDLCVLERDDDTPGRRWLRALSVGDDVAFLGPQGKLVLSDTSSFHLFIGEETAQVAFAPMLDALPSERLVYGVIEVVGPEAHLPMARADELTWHHRGDAPAVRSPGILDALEHLDLPDEPGTAYVAGEAQTCVAVRQHLIKQRGWPSRGAIIVKPFWTPGKKGLE
jgi:NADPH-dependent ferric siderophore reductase